MLGALLWGIGASMAIAEENEKVKTKSDKERIAELEKENAKLEGRLADLTSEYYELEKENAELDCQKNRNKSCYSCANATERCFKNEIGCPCHNYKSYKEENAELKKDKSELCHSINEAGKAYCNAQKKAEKQLTKAKEIIEKLISQNRKEWIYSDVREEAEQFLKELEK